MHIFKSLTHLGRAGLTPSRSLLISTNKCLLKSSRTYNIYSAKVPMKSLTVEPLVDRDLIKVQGEEALPFLQGLVTNDMSHMQFAHPSGNLASMYALFLNKNGRVLYDTIIHRLDESPGQLQSKEPPYYLIECDKAVSNDLRRHLRIYRVRRKIDIQLGEDEYKLYAVFNSQDSSDTNFPVQFEADDIYYAPDPRLSELGLRVITTEGKGWIDVAKMFQLPQVTCTQPRANTNYRIHRYNIGVGEGPIELPMGKCFPLEANADYLHGVSFKKGCYIGQELTARTYHTGVVRKRLMPLNIGKPVASGTPVINSSGASLGVVRDSIHNRALALLRVEKVMSQLQLLVDNEVCHPEKPKWWPEEAMKTKRFNRQ